MINTTRNFAELGIEDYTRSRPIHRNLTVPASDIALAHIGRPLPNAALLGGFAAATGRVKIESVCEAIAEKFKGKVAIANIAAATQAYEYVTKQLKELGHVAAN